MVLPRGELHCHGAVDGIEDDDEDRVEARGEHSREALDVHLGKGRVRGRGRDRGRVRGKPTFMGVSIPDPNPNPNPNSPP